MNVCFQIGIGLLPGVIFTAVLLCRRRAFRIKNILLTLALAVVCVSLIVIGGKDVLKNGMNSPKQLSQKKMISYANALYIEGAYNEVKEVLDEYSANYGYDDDCRLLTARLYLAQEDYVRARGLYTFLAEDSKLLSPDDEEVQFVTVKYESYEENPTVMQTDKNDVVQKVCNHIVEEYAINDNYISYANAVASVSEAFDSIDNDDSTSRSKYKYAFKAIEKKEDALLSLECVHKARIKAYVIAGDYDEMTEELSSNSTYHELMIVAELYMNGLADKADLSKEYQIINQTEADSVEKQVNKVYNNSKEGITVQDKKSMKTRVDAIVAQLNDPALVTIKQQLLESAEKEAGTDQTKVYLEIAKIENYFGNKTSTASYLSEAIYYSQECVDTAYVSAMAQIMGVIHNDDTSGTGNIKNVSEYVKTVLDHSLTVDIEQMISPQYQEQSDSEVDNEESNKVGSNKVDFAQAAVDYVSRIKSAISIGKIDTTSFENITAKVQITSDYSNDINKLKKEIKVYDCGAEVTDFTLSKIDYSGSNITLCCDVSGSMQESIEHLRNAVVTFIADKNVNEKLSIVTFNQSIVETKPFGTSDQELTAFAEIMEADGGTDMFSAVINSLTSFSDTGGMNNVLILMTDGQDNEPKSSDEIYAEIGKLAEQKGVTVYTLGLGTDVDTAYLGTIANSGNGEFIYVSDSISLTSFYDMIHGQLYSQYKIEYSAIDTMTMSDRTLEVTLPSEKLRDVKSYSVGDANDAGNSLQISRDLSISGLSPRYLYKGSQDVAAKLKGTGFKVDDKINVKLAGNIDYTLLAEYVDKETIKVTVPASVAVGTYNVEVTINGQKKILQNGFSVVVQGNEKKTEFGPYVFSSVERIENSDGSYTLRGLVQMNGWLNFKSDITLSGDLENDGAISVTDESGSYVDFDKATAEGLANFLAQKGISLDLPELHNFTLYNDQMHLYDYSNYHVDDISMGILEIYQVLHFDSPIVRLYPNSIGLYYSTGKTILPYQDRILKACGVAKKPFDFTFDGNAQITKKQVGIVAEISYKDPSKEYDHTINLFNSPVYFNGSVKAKINTIKNEYTVGAMIRFAFFAKQSGMGLEISWKDGTVNSVETSLNLQQAIKLKTTVPVEVNDFAFKVSDIQSSLDKGTWKNLKFTGSVTLSSCKISEYVPSLQKFLGDISIFEMPKTTASLRISPFQVEASAKLKFLKEITLADAEIKIGNFDYTNELLSLNSANVDGLSAKLKSGLMWSSGNGKISLELSGTGEFDAHSRFVGVEYTGVASYNISWWLIKSGRTRTGSIAFGLYTTSDGKMELILANKYQDSKGKIRGVFYYIDENGTCGKTKGSLT